MDEAEPFRKATASKNVGQCWQFPGIYNFIPSKAFEAKLRALVVPKRCEAANILGSIANYAKDRLKQAQKTSFVPD